VSVLDIQSIRNASLKSIALLILIALPLHGAAKTATSSTYNVTRDIVYGDPQDAYSELQSLDIYWQDNKVARPVIIYVHGGSWALGDKSDVNSKPDFFVPEDIVFISMNYRLRWDHQLYDQLDDIVSVVKWVKANSETFGLDSDRVILMGHEAGAHLVSLVSTDPRYMKAQGMSLKSIKAAVAIDTMSFDIPRVMKELGSFVQRRQHRLIFGEELASQLAASPITHIDQGKNIPQFALLYVADDEVNQIQTQAFAKSLISANVSVIIIPGNATTRQTIDVELGTSKDAPSGALMAFIRATF
jgi:arylformamidase